MKHWQTRYFLFFLLALCCGALAGWAVGLFFQMNPTQVIIFGLIGALGGVTLLWLWTLKSLSTMMEWLAYEDAPAQIQGLPQQGYWGELVRRLTKALRWRDLQIEEKKEQLVHLFSALQSAPIGILLLDLDEHLVWGNAHAATDFKLSFPKDYQQQITNLIRAPEFVHYLSDLREGKTPSPLELSNTIEQNKSFIVQMVTDESHFYRLLLIQDVTKQVQMHQMRVDFVANVSHEIRTPLTVLSGFVETMQQLPLEAKERSHYLQLMAQQCYRIQHLVSDLLVLAKLESSAATQTEIWNNISDLFAQVQQMAQELSAGKHHITISTPSDDLQVEIAGDTSEILSAMTNLVSNAIAYTPQGGTVALSWQLNEKNECVFAVKDNGAGIAKEHLGRLTERFYRVDKGRSQQSGGTGLGLAITKHIMQRYGGRLKIDSTLGKGSEFSLYFVKIKRS